MNDREVIRSFEGFHNGRFVAFAGVALLVFAVVVFGLVRGFRGNHVAKSADAMTLVGASAAKAPPAPPAK
jgi:hypothetical protein